MGEAPRSGRDIGFELAALCEPHRGSVSHPGVTANDADLQTNKMLATTLTTHELTRFGCPMPLTVLASHCVSAIHALR